MSTERVACLLVPDLPLAALLRVEPGLVDRPVAVVDGPGPRACVLAAQPSLYRVGVRPGLTAVQVHSLVPDAELRPLSAVQVRAARAALSDVARGFSPRVNLGQAEGEVYLDAGGLGRLHPTEFDLGLSLRSAARRVGLEVRVGLGCDRLVARLAAVTCPTGRGPEIQVVPAGREREFLAPLPISLLESSARLRAAFERFGIERLGQLAQLPGAGLGRRLGPEGLRLWRMARGEAADPLFSDPLSERFVEIRDPGWPIGRLEPLLAELDALLTRLEARLACRGLVASGLDLTFELDPEGSHQRPIRLASPTRLKATWLDVIRLDLTQDPLGAPVNEFCIEALPVAAKAGQLDFFANAGIPASAVLDDMLAKLAAIVGADRVGSPHLPDSHHPDVAGLRPLGSGGADGPEDRYTPHPPVRVLRPPVPARVRLEGRRPGYLRTDALGGRVRRAAGPWRIEWGWWRAEQLNRDYFDVELADGGLYRLYLDRDSGDWFVDGICG